MTQEAARHRIAGLNFNKLRQYVGIAIGLAAVGYFLRGSEPRAAGIPFIAAGLALRLWASGHLSKNASLTTSGPYRYVRHPLYLGNLIAFAGVPIIVGIYWLVPVIYGALLVIYHLHIAQEERELCERFGQSYEDYMRKVASLIPLPWRIAPRSAGKFSWRRAIMENRWHHGALCAVAALVAIDLLEDVLYPALFLGKPLSACAPGLLDIAKVWHTGYF